MHTGLATSHVSRMSEVVPEGLANIPSEAAILRGSKLFTSRVLDVRDMRETDERPLEALDVPARSAQRHQAVIHGMPVFPLLQVQGRKAILLHQAQASRSLDEVGDVLALHPRSLAL